MFRLNSPVPAMILLEPAIEPIEAAPATEATVIVIDRAHLGRFTMGNLSLEAEVLSLFIEQAPVYLERLKTASTQKDWFAAAHTLKGSARAVGARQVADLTEAAERLRIDTCGPRRAEAVRSIADALDRAARTIAAITDELAQTTGRGA